MMKIAQTCTELNECLRGIDVSKRGFVPTMGALHKGHISLVDRAKEQSDIVIASVFVNPTQFNDADDLRDYPRTPQADIDMLEKAGVDIVFIPTVEEIYPETDKRVFNFGLIDKVMEGPSRPGHFNGVAQVVSRLLDLVEPGKAYFGEKDFQQIAVIRAMCDMLGYGVEIIACPTVREADGLAMSSRNQLLDSSRRKSAPKIYAAMQEAVGIVKAALANKDRGSCEAVSPREIENMVAEEINSDPLLEVIYFKIVNARTLQDIQDWNEPEGAQGCIAVKAGSVRLIDNIRFV